MFHPLRHREENGTIITRYESAHEAAIHRGEREALEAELERLLRSFVRPKLHLCEGLWHRVDLARKYDS